MLRLANGLKSGKGAQIVDDHLILSQVSLAKTVKEGPNLAVLAAGPPVLQFLPLDAGER